MHFDELLQFVEHDMRTINGVQETETLTYSIASDKAVRERSKNDWCEFLLVHTRNSNGPPAIRQPRLHAGDVAL